MVILYQIIFNNYLDSPFPLSFKTPVIPNGAKRNEESLDKLPSYFLHVTY